MGDLEILEQYKNETNLADVINDIKKLDNLVLLQDWLGVQQHTQALKQKHMQKLIIYNIANSSPPTSIQQNAVNCRDFLVCYGLKIVVEIRQRNNLYILIIA